MLYYFLPAITMAILALLDTSTWIIRQRPCPEHPLQSLPVLERGRLVGWSVALFWFSLATVFGGISKLTIWHHASWQVPLRVHVLAAVTGALFIAAGAVTLYNTLRSLRDRPRRRLATTIQRLAALGTIVVTSVDFATRITLGQEDWLSRSWNALLGL